MSKSTALKRQRVSKCNLGLGFVESHYQLEAIRSDVKCEVTDDLRCVVKVKRSAVILFIVKKWTEKTGSVRMILTASVFSHELKIKRREG